MVQFSPGFDRMELMKIEMLPHHAEMFAKLLYERGPEGLAEYLSYDESHRRALEKNLTDIMGSGQDDPITLIRGENDILCEACPGQVGPFRLPGLGIHDKCNLKTPEALQRERKATSRIKKLTGKKNPTVREIYQASCDEWEG